MPDVTQVGETPAEQMPPASTVAREKMIEIIANSKRVLADCEAMLDVLNTKPELDATFCRLFNIVKK